MAIGSDNVFPKVIIDEGTTPSTPAAGTQKLFIDSADHHLKRVDESDAVVDIEAAGGGYTQGARVYDSDGQSISNDTITAIAFDTERYDTDVIHDNATNNTRLTCKTAGKYIIVGNVQWAASATGRRELDIRMNGTTYIGAQMVEPESGISFYQNVTTIYDLAINDYVELMALQNSGGALSIEVGASYSPEFMMQRIG